MPSQSDSQLNKPISQAADKHYHFSDSVNGTVRSNMTSTTQCVSIMTFSGRSLSGRRSELGVTFQTQIQISSCDFWKVKFHPSRLDNYLKDEDKFSQDKYTCEETIIEVSVEKSRRRGLTKRCQKLEIEWQQVDEHLEGLSDLFNMGRKITLSMEFVYKEVASDSATAKGKKKKKARQKLKGFREPPKLVSGLEFTSSIAVKPNTASKDPTAGRMSEGITRSYCPPSLKRLSDISKRR
jgi:hypothetical protein